MICSALECLSIIANSIAFLTCLVSNVQIISKSIKSKASGISVSSSDYDAHKTLFALIKSCGRCGFFFQLFAWLIFSKKQKSFIELSKLTYDFAVAWAIMALFTILVGVVIGIIKTYNDTELTKKKTLWFAFYSLLYFAVSFLIG